MHFLTKKAIKQYFTKTTIGGQIFDQDFWILVVTFLSNKGCLVSDDVFLILGNQIVADASEPNEIFNNQSD